MKFFNDLLYKLFKFSFSNNLSKAIKSVTKTCLALLPSNGQQYQQLPIGQLIFLLGCILILVYVAIMMPNLVVQ